MLTTRAVGPVKLGGEVRDWNDRTHAEMACIYGLTMHTEYTAKNAGYQEEIDHRSYERQGFEKTPAFTQAIWSGDGNTRYRNRTRANRNHQINRLNPGIYRFHALNSGTAGWIRASPAVWLTFEYRSFLTTQLRTHYVTSSKLLPAGQCNAAWKLSPPVMPPYRRWQICRRRADAGKS